MDHIERSGRALAAAERIYEDRDRAEQWMSRPNPRLGGSTPAALLETADGAHRVEELLGQIDEGHFI